MSVSLSKKVLIVSAVNLTEGGTLTILKKCLSFLDTNPLIYNEYTIIALVHKKDYFQYNNIVLIDFPKAKSSWLFRLYYEYWGFYKLSLDLKPFLWLSLHDISPNVRAARKAVYCHNPTPFYHAKLKDLYYNYKVFLFSYLYKYLYKINIRTNNYVIVQQQWLREAFVKMYKLTEQNVIVAYPQEILDNPIIENEVFQGLNSYSDNIFFFPSLSRPFKNFEVICNAADLLVKWGNNNFKVILTIDGKEDAYSKAIVDKYHNNPNILFSGRLIYEDVVRMYEKTLCLIFPSKLETWGLPISEFSNYRKPMIVADLPYAHETASGAEQVAFFNPNDSIQLAELMLRVINRDMSLFHPVHPRKLNSPYTCSWNELFNILLK